MPIRTVVCQDCQEPLPHGRLSCPRCGTPLASVAGAYRAPARGAVSDTLAAGTRWPHGPALVDTARSVGGGDLDDASEPLPGTDQPATPAPQPQVLPPEPVPPVAPPPSADEIVPSGAPADVDDVSEPAPPDVEAPSEARNAGSPAVRFADAEPWPFLRAASVRRSSAADGGGHAPEEPPPFLERRLGGRRGDPGAPAGAYLPPTEPVALPGTRGTATAASAASRPWGLIRADRAPRPLEPVAQASGAAAIPPATAPAVATRAAPASSPSRRVADLFADLPFRVPRDTPGRLVVAGSALAAVAFLLPWTSTPAFGAGYTAEWGFAVGSHVVPWLAAVALLVFSVLPNELPASVRGAAIPLALGGVLLGLAWSYVLGPAGSHLGSWAVTIAGIVLIAGGVTALLLAPSESSTPSV